MLKELIIANRSYRRFYEETPVAETTLRELVDLARLSASAGNLQPLKYILSCTPEQNALIFPHLNWAGYLPDWPGPAEGERPTAYIIIMLDTNIEGHTECDQGIAAQGMLLGAAERGLGGCMIGSIKRKALRQALAIPSRYELLLVIALGKPKETVILDEVRDGNIEYWHDDQDRHHVPKRLLDDLIL